MSVGMKNQQRARCIQRPAHQSLKRHRLENRMQCHLGYWQELWSVKDPDTTWLGLMTKQGRRQTLQAHSSLQSIFRQHLLVTNISQKPGSENTQKTMPKNSPLISASQAEKREQRCCGANGTIHMVIMGWSKAFENADRETWRGS